MARRFARSLKQQLDKDRSKAKEEHKSMYRFDEEEVLCAEIAGLCHDLGIHNNIMIVSLLQLLAIYAWV